MIVDCHTHIWQTPEQLGRMVLGDLPRPGQATIAGMAGRERAGGNYFVPRATWHSMPASLAADLDHHIAQSNAVDKSIVLGFKSRYLNAEIPNRFLADYVAQYPQKLIGFAGIDPTEQGAIEEIRNAQSDLHLRGITISPANQDFHPTDSRAMRIYADAAELGMPILIHSTGQFTAQSKLEYARPYLFDEAARLFPRHPFIFSQMGHPWIGETICLMGKHAGVYADVSGLLARPWEAYNALVLAYQAGVADKLLFGSDFPYTNAVQCIEALYSLNQVAQGSNLPIVPREVLRGIVERDSLALLGLTDDGRKGEE